MWLKILLGIIGFFAVDAALGRIFQHDTRTRLLLLGPKSAKRGVVVLHGFACNEIVGRALAEHMPADVAVIVVGLPKWGLDPAVIYNQTTAAIKELGLERVVLYGNSMGGELAAMWLRRYLQERQPTVRLAPIVLDTAPSSPETAKSPIPLWLGRYWRGGPLTGSIYAVGVKLERRRRPWPGVQPGCNPMLVREIYRQLSYPAMAAVTAQSGFLSRFRARPGEFRGYSAVFIKGQGTDPMVDVAPAINGWRAAFGGQLRVVTDESRQPGWHAPVVELPERVVQIILEQIP